ncbi:MAG: hypothetical protein V3T17_17035 [Pseudomonadales bacterium]
MIPLHLDGLFLSDNQLTTEAHADFSRLPYSDSGIDRNPDTANISENILSVPFQNNNLNLKKGMHLHWSLPDGLTKGAAGGTAEDYPSVPNRWLITRKKSGTLDQQWIVESDYLHPEGEENSYVSIAYPIDTPSGQPFRYLGRQLDYVGWQEDTTVERLSRLTAIGYGEPAFAAFYPDCHSVFGCFDAAITEQSELTDLSYQLIGWYSDQNQDPLIQLINDHTGADKDTLEQLIKDQFGWNLAIDTDKLPQGMSCYADLAFIPNADINNDKKDQAATVSVGNTGTEALSAYMADRLNPTNTIQLEEQLENLALQTGLQSKQLDLGPRFKEARHEKEFKAEKGGSLWEIKPANDNTNNSPAQIILSAGMAATLDELNIGQQQLDKEKEQRQHKKHLLFADWYKYMLCAYPPDDARDDYPDIDLVKYYIEKTQLPLIQQATAAIGTRAIEVGAIKDSLAQQISKFNESTLSQTILDKPLDKDTADTSGLTLNGSVLPWLENAPFSTHCLNFNGSDAYISISSLSNVKAISLWVNLATQNTDDATLLATQDSGVLIAKNEINDFWTRISINGQDHPTYKALQWYNLPKDQWIHLHVEFTESLQNTDTLYLFGNANSQFLKGKLAAVRVFNEALSPDEIYADQNMLGHQHYELKEGAGPRFWQPTEPVVLLEGQSVEPTTRHGEDGRLSADNTLSCQTKSVTSYPLQEADLTALLAEIDSLKPAGGEEKTGYDTWTMQPWHPFLLEWEVEVFPLAEAGNLKSDKRRFDPAFINTNFELAENSPKLSVKSNKSVIKAAALYRGRSVLTPYAKEQLIKTITGQLNNLKQEDGYQAISEITDADKDSYHQELDSWYATKPENDSAIAGYETWYLAKPVYNNGIKTFSEEFTDETARLNDFNYVLIKTYEELNNGHFISQALGGFNSALLMHHQTLQCPVSDPLGFDDYRAFTDKVKAAIGSNTNMAPLPFNDFMPIRSGTMRLHQLHVIDTFGQVKKDLALATLIKSETLTLPTTPVQNTASHDVWLAPRLLQPARINFRWLSASNGTQELNTHPENTPICGWLLANHLDNSLAIYDQDGIALGSIDQEAKWRAVPGTDVSFDPLDVLNLYLRNVIQRLAITAAEQEENDPDLLTGKKDFFQDFITVTDKALENIDPEAFVHHQELVLLMGRPIAVVRASVNLELKGNPEIHHGWTEFYQDLERDDRETDDFEKVKIPLRIGERGQLNDGVLGYWKEDEENQLDDTFHTTVVSGTVSSTHIKSYDDEPLNISHSLNDAPETLTLLIDPRCEVHATTGLLPAKSIDIPKDQYTRALKNINITFLSAPILTGVDQIALPLPNEMGYEWSWLAKDRFNWVEVARSGIIRKDTVIKTFENGTEIWQALLAKGWITEIDGNRAKIVSADQRTIADLGTPINAQTDKIQQLLDAGHILPTETKATFNDKQHIKEGWLKLSPHQGN